MELQKNTVEKKTFELLTLLMNEELFREFFLVGGTALALRYGHRKSIDIDMFTQRDISVGEFQKYLSEKYDFLEEYRAKNTLKGAINGIKVDFIKYDYPLLEPPERTSENIRILSTKDIIAMKLSAITDSGSRVKDFTDIAFLSKYFTLNQMLSFYKEKFQGANIFSVTKALVYYDDIDFHNEPVSLISGKFEWSRIANRLKNMIQNPEKIYKDFPIPKIEKEYGIER